MAAEARLALWRDRSPQRRSRAGRDTKRSAAKAFAVAERARMNTVALRAARERDSQTEVPSVIASARGTYRAGYRASGQQCCECEA